MTYRDAINNLMEVSIMGARTIPYCKATFIKINELLDKLEQESYGDCISRQAVLDMATTIQTDDYSGNEIMEVVDVNDVKALPPVTPQKMGHWIVKNEESAVCSCCYRNNKLYGDYCKWCGAKMVET